MRELAAAGVPQIPADVHAQFVAGWEFALSADDEERASAAIAAGVRALRVRNGLPAEPIQDES